MFLKDYLKLKFPRLTALVVIILGFYLEVTCQMTWNKSIDFHNELNHSESIFEQSNGDFIVGVLTYPDSISFQGALLGVNPKGDVDWSDGIEEASHGFFMRGAYQAVQNQIWSFGVV